jgi:hypothetical protein
MFQPPTFDPFSNHSSFFLVLNLIKINLKCTFYGLRGLHFPRVSLRTKKETDCTLDLVRHLKENSRELHNCSEDEKLQGES